MRLFAISFLLPIFACAAIAEKVPSVEVQASGSITSKSAKDLSDGTPTTIFNGVEVPPLTEIDGESFNSTVKDGYWFVKHYSPYCVHCKHIAPTWQTLYEYYYTSRPVPAGTSADTASTSMNTFHAYYDFHFGSLNCVAFGSTCQAHDVTAWPTFVLYKNGEEFKRPEEIPDMKTLSEFIEECLESIKAGSRPIDGPELPKPGAKSSKDYQSAVASSQQDVASSEDGNARVSNKGFKVISKQTKSTKPVTPPNPSGTSIPFAAESFQNLVTMTQDPWFIEFYAPWCGHCKAMAPVWVQLAREMKGKLNVGEVNCDIETRLCKDVHLKGFPTILFFRGGERVEYDGLRGLGDFISYANKAIDAGAGVQDIDASEFKVLEEKEEVIFVYFYDHATTSEDFAAIERLTLSLIGHAKLVKTNSAALAERFKITAWPRLMVSRNGRPTYYTALSPQDMRDYRRVLHWMQSVWLPIVPELTASNAQEIMDGKIVVLGILSRERSDEFLMAQKEMKSAAIEWMDKQTLNFQRERQELRDAKQLRIEEAEDRNDQRALRNAKLIHINMDKSDQKEVVFAWVDGVFWERWIRTTYGIEVAKDGEKVIINDDDNRRYWDQTINGNPIMASRTSILETIPKVVSNPPKIKPKSTIGFLEKLAFNIRHTFGRHPFVTVGLILSLMLGTIYGRRRIRRSRGGFFRLDEKDNLGLLGGNVSGKVD